VTLELIAPAKVNLILEVTGRRQDGYHDIASVMQAIDLADRVRLTPAVDIELALVGEELRGVPFEGPRNLAYAAAQALMAMAGSTGLGARIELDKRIPAGMGLGGGSTDAAAVLRGLNRLWGLDLRDDDLLDVAAAVGSDVPFFIVGGAALVTGRGEQVKALPDPPPLDITLFVAPIEIEDKTRRMYSTLSPADFSDGSRALALAYAIQGGHFLQSTDWCNAFDRNIEEVARPTAAAMALCRDAGISVVVSGSGPGFFTPAALSNLPPLLLRELERDWGVRAVACRSLSRAESTALREV
jgi:4-diphosphocytidyl-2-C-methyl-D-erythritol kinase